MNIYGRSTPETINKLITKLGDGTWDAANGLCPHLCGQQNDLIVIKLQGACSTNAGLGASDIHVPLSFWTVFDSHHIKTVERFKDDPNHEFHEEEFSFEQWMELYNKSKDKS